MDRIQPGGHGSSPNMVIMGLAAVKVYPPGLDINVGMIWSAGLQQVSYGVHSVLPLGKFIDNTEYDMSDNALEQLQRGKIERKKSLEMIKSACAGI